MARHWTSAAPASCKWHRRLVLALFLGVSACSEMPDDTSFVAAPEPPPATPPAFSEKLLTGVTTGLPIDVWICADKAGLNLGYTFDAVGSTDAASGVGHEVVLAERRSRAFQWTMQAAGQVQIQFVDDDSLLEWQQLAYGDQSRLNLDSSERGALQCLRQTVNTAPGPGQAFDASVAAGEAILPSSGERLIKLLPGELSGNRADDLSAIGALEQISLWICQSPSGLKAQAYFVPTLDEVQGLFIDASGINAVRRGRWMTLADDTVRLDLAGQGEVILSDVRLDGSTRFSAISDREGMLSCERESLTFPAPQDAS